MTKKKNNFNMESNVVIYTSNRFKIIGNISYKIEVRDKLKNKEYTVQYQHLKKIRDNFHKVKKEANKDLLILAMLSAMRT